MSVYVTINLSDIHGCAVLKDKLAENTDQMFALLPISPEKWHINKNENALVKLFIVQCNSVIWFHLC